MVTGTPVKTRTRKSPQDIAVAELEKAEKRLEKAQDSAEKWEEKLEEAIAERDRAQRYVDFLRQNPDLPQTDSPDTPPEMTAAS
jgi:DNA repair ATPase RecN